MPNIRYYDYGVMRREADRRMYDAQRRAGHDGSVPTKRVTPDYSEQTRPESGSLPTCTQDAPECDNIACAEDCADCHVQEKAPAISINAEELLIIALLMLTLSEGRNMPLALVLLYLLI